jgi:hypothetical protein
MFLHQMYVYERFNNRLKSFIRNRAYPEASMVQGYCIEEAVEWTLNYTDLTNMIGFPKSCHEGRLIGKWTIGKNAIPLDPNLFRCAHFHVLQQMSIVSEYLEEHKKVLDRDNSGCNESWLVNEHVRKFIGWLGDQISKSSDTQISEYLKNWVHGPIFTIVRYQWYDIIRYMLHTEQQDKKSTYQNSGVHADAYDVMGQDKNMYYGKIQEIWDVDFHGLKIHLFRCNWVDAIKDVVEGKYGFISVDLNHQRYKSEPFMLAKYVGQVFYVPNTTNKRIKLVIPRKR